MFGMLWTAMTVTIKLLNEQTVASQGVVLRELSEIEQQKLFLLENTDYKTYRLLNRIIKCESNWDANAYNSKTKDWGLMQISERYWDAFAQTTSFADYKTNWKSNLLLGKYIYEVQGVGAWAWSYNCHHIK